MHKQLLLKPEQALAIAQQLLNSGQAQQALETLLQAYNREPSHETLALQLARLLHQHHQNKDALIILNKTYHLGTQTFELGYFLAALLQLEKHFSQSERVIRQCLTKQPDSAAAHNLLGAVLIEQNRYEPGILAYLESIKLNPNSADAHNNLAWAYRATGKKQEAIKHFEQAFKIDASATEALSGLFMLKTFKERTKEFDAVESLICDSSLSIKQKTELEFALGKAYEDIGNHHRAFQHFQHANKSWRKTIDYRIEDDKALFDSIKQRFTKESIASAQQNSTKPNTIQPIFIVGMPRSSTTLIEQILSSHSSVIGAGELPFLEPLVLDNQGDLHWPHGASRDSLAKLATSYLDAMNKHVELETTSETRFITDKLPQNFRFIGAILTLFPHAKIIHCKRQAMDTCLSLFKHHFPMSNHYYSYDLQELGQYYKLYEELMAYWHSIVPGQILDVQYEAILDDVEHEVLSMLTFCELPFESNCLSFQHNPRAVRTASSDQVRQGLYKTAAGRWQLYEEELAELKASLQSYS